MSKTIRAIIFDFDGVIAESVSVKTDAFAELYRPYGKLIVGKVIAHHIKNGGMSRFEKFNIYHSEFLNTPITEEKVKKLADKFSQIVFKKVIDAPYVDGAYDFLNDNYLKYDLFISSGTPQKEINLICKKKNIHHLFKEILGSPQKKEEHVKAIMDKYSYSAEEVIFVGDAESDRKAAHKNDIYFIGRLNDGVDLSFEKYKIKDLRGLENIIKEIINS